IKDKRVRNKRNRSAQETNHRGGSRPWARYTQEHLEKTGVLPSRGQLWIKFHQLPNGEYKTTKGRVVAELVEQLEAAGAPTAWGPNDSLAQALAKPEHRGRLRAAGAGKLPSKVFGDRRRAAGYSSSSSSSVSSAVPASPGVRAELDTVKSQLTQTLERQARME
ncbi:hypothetical protein LINGRAHAP2_LOCUS35060, partial [Linum grandiflorum]